MGHDVLAEKAARIGETVRVLVGRGVEHQARILRSEGGEHDQARFLHLTLFLAVEILDGSHARALCIGEDPRHVAHGPHFRALGPGLAPHRWPALAAAGTEGGVGWVWGGAWGAPPAPHQPSWIQAALPWYSVL